MWDSFWSGGIIDSLTKNGYLDVDDLYEQPFKRMGDPDVVFHEPSDIDVAVDVLNYVRNTAIPTDAEAS